MPRLAVDQFNERSAEANLTCLLELDPPPEQDVSWGGAWEGDLSPDIPWPHYSP